MTFVLMFTPQNYALFPILATFSQEKFQKKSSFSVTAKHSNRYTYKFFSQNSVFNKYHVDFFIIFAAYVKHFNIAINKMKTKFLNALQTKCKDMGLSKKALNELTEIGSANLNDDSSDDDINAAVDSIVPYAKAMQSEITRKTSKPSTKPSEKNEGGEGENNNNGGNANDDVIPAWAQKWQHRLDSLESENAALKAEKAASERNAQIAEKAKSLGIPEYLMKRFNIADDADIDAELTSFKQDLVNNNLVPKGHAHEGGSTEQQDIADAEAWAQSLPNR